ncbi:MAG TPA: S8 family serine peptidase, partial [Acidimicrobiales bacterium]|nr:S8 family serine peptidase [Acidimicrobiales bacterium]
MAGPALVWPPRADASPAIAFPKGPPNDPGYAPAEASPPPCSTVSVNDEQFYLYSFLPRCATAARDPEGASGMSVDRAWANYTTGRPDTVIAYVEGGINWHDTDVAELSNKVYLNMGELPVPCRASGPCVTRHSDRLSDYDLNHDGVLDAADYASDPRVHDVNGNGVIDPEDVIAAFSCYDERTETIGKATWPGGHLHCSNGAAGVDNDHDGYPHDISGWDFYDGQNDPATVDGAYGHANDQMRQAAAQTNNGLLGAGICPRCTILPVKAGAEAIDGPVQLAEAWMYAADAGASVIVSVTADAAHSSVLADALRYVESKGVVVVESSNDFDSVDHQGGMYWPGVLPGNSLVANTAGVSGAAAANSRTTTFRARSDETSWGPHNVFSVPTQGGSTSEATPTLGAVVALLLSWGKEAAARHLISSPLTGPEAVQVLRATASPVDDPAPAWPGGPGWSEQYGYGRPNVAAAMQAVAEGR